MVGENDEITGDQKYRVNTRQLTAYFQKEWLFAELWAMFNRHIFREYPDCDYGTATVFFALVKLFDG